MKRVLIGVVLVLLFCAFGVSAGTAGSSKEKEQWTVPTPAEARILGRVLERMQAHISEVEIAIESASIVFSKESSKDKISAGEDRLIVTCMPGAFERYQVRLGRAVCREWAMGCWFIPYMQVSVDSTDRVHGALFKKIKTLYSDGIKLVEKRERKKEEDKNKENLNKADRTFRW